jgi:phosphoribosylformylglycinamidine synthase
VAQPRGGGRPPSPPTDNLNFGNPEKPEVMGQLVGAIQGIGEACRVLDFPVVSGNVSLYNETDGQAILPTPTIGGVGLLSFLDEHVAGPGREGDALVLIGPTTGHLGQSALLAVAFGIEAGDAPPVDLDCERRNGEFVLGHRGLIRAATDLADGGLALAAFELAEAAGVGAHLDMGGISALFGEDQARYLLATGDPEALVAAADRAGVSAAAVGRLGGEEFRMGGEAAPMVELLALWRGAFEAALDL